MAIIVNNPGESSGDSSAMGMILGIIIALLVVGVLLITLYPTFRSALQENNGTPTGIKTELPVVPSPVPPLPTAPTPQPTQTN